MLPAHKWRSLRAYRELCSSEIWSRSLNPLDEGKKVRTIRRRLLNPLDEGKKVRIIGGRSLNPLDEGKKVRTIGGRS